MDDGPKIVQEAGLDFLAYLRGSVGDVNGKSNRHVIAALGMACGAQGPPIECHLLSEFCSGVDRRRDKYRIALFPSEHRGLWTIRSDPDWRVGLLQGLGHDGGRGHLKELAIK